MTNELIARSYGIGKINGGPVEAASPLEWPDQIPK